MSPLKHENVNLDGERSVASAARAARREHKINEALAATTGDAGLAQGNKAKAALQDDE